MSHMTGNLPRTTLLHSIYQLSIFKVIEKHLPTRGFGYADDTQLLHTFKPVSAKSGKTAINAIQDCIMDMKSGWLHVNLD